MAVCCVPHFAYPDEDLPENVWYYSTFGEGKKWHRDSRHVLSQRADLQPPTCMQDTAKTISIYEETLYPTLIRLGLDQVVEDNASPHNNDTIRASHTATCSYRWVHRHSWGKRGDSGIDSTPDWGVQTWTRQKDTGDETDTRVGTSTGVAPNSPDLNLIEIVWTWMVKGIRDGEGGWPSDPELLKQRVIAAWDAIPLESFRELVRSYRIRLETIVSVDGDRHPQFAWVLLLFWGSVSVRILSGWGRFECSIKYFMCLLYVCITTGVCVCSHVMSILICMYIKHIVPSKVG